MDRDYCQSLLLLRPLSGSISATALANTFSTDLLASIEGKRLAVDAVARCLMHLSFSQCKGYSPEHSASRAALISLDAKPSHVNMSYLFNL